MGWRRRISVVIVALVALLGAWFVTRDGGPDARQPELPKLTISQLAGMRVVASFRNTSEGRVPAALARRIRAGTIGAVCLFAGNGTKVATIRSLTRKLQAIPRPAGLREPLLVMIDQEGGKVRRITDSPPAESALAMAATSNVAHIRARGLATAGGLRRAGVNIDLAPVADIPRTGSTLLAFKRTFGTDPATVGKFAAAFASGLVAGGVQATAKHFPGFGAAKVNSDDQQVSIGLSASTLRTVDEASFKQVIAAKARLVMVGNATYPALDPSAPASLSRKISTTEVRQQLGFDGVTITDDLEAGALKPFGGPAQIAVRSASAGNDLVLFARKYQSSVSAARAIAAAIRSGRISMTDARAAAVRILALRRAVAAAGSR